MEKLEQARKLYLRGFGSKYIKQNTGISMQSLLKQLRAKGDILSKSDIVNYQIRYICENYTKDNICDAYRRMFHTVASDEAIRKGREARTQTLLERY